MAIHNPDYRLLKAKELIDNLNPLSPDNSLIIYYLQKQNEEIQNLNKQITEYKKFFNLLNNLLPKSEGNIVYGRK